MPLGRKSDYTQEMADKICLELAGGKSLRRICKEEGMPSKSTVLNWVLKNEDFRDQYRCAREIQAETFADELTDIADDGSNDFMMVEKYGKEVEMLDREHVQRSQLRIETRKWIAMKLKPKKYGDKVEVEHSGEVTNKNIEIVHKHDIDNDDIDFVDS